MTAPTNRRVSRSPIPHLHRSVVYQLAIWFPVCWAVALTASVGGVLLLGRSETSGLLVQRLTSDRIAIFALVVAPLLLSVAVAAAVFSRKAFKVTGPLYRYEQVFRGISEGTLVDGFTTREGDYLQTTTKVLSTACRDLCAMVMRVNAVAHHIEQVADDLSETDKEKLSAFVAQLREALPQVPADVKSTASSRAVSASAAEALSPEEAYDLHRTI